MDKLEFKVFVLGGLSTNCYLIFDRETKKGFLIDSPCFSKELNEFVEDENLKIQFIALTHAHFDHIGGLGESREFYIHKEDIPLLKDASLNFSSFLNSSFTVKAQPRLYQENTLLPFNSHNLEVIHTPGHTPGSVCLKLGKWLFSGDTIFFDSIGRTDIPGASTDLLIKSIKEKIFPMAEDIIVYPGHGPSTTIGREKKCNPFLRN
ncbi:MAG: MBL fold metallo-hydrolase [Candidatus Omnitrophica bacterium]|nr:MBL fold metallo-hydrolase [Candidatus Omnitrophota bacterium]MBU1133693.1 MBL fold metallo-hydrolase [Candidatus Omnitrophota bacterium]MBU1367001.1 MBL fold metallo-hydrolase [Candidatus Omnitrophota bacterium]MBU1523069.1 MBL fold metallo-hydrolase [Candidatus Omnitrophota bacterium]MBU1810324.1 MBL fold metallo-hydrolase [Candidatus Omnitrophota bacterium]